MPWMQMRVPHWADASPVQDTLAKAARRLAEDGTGDGKLALISRPIEGLDADLLLLSPSAARYSSLLPGDWVEAPDPQGSGWKLLFTSGVTIGDLGLQS